MFKYAFLAGAMIASPVVAQTAVQSGQNTQAAPVQGGSAQAATATPAADPAAAAQPATTSTQVAQIVGAEFPTYDSNGDGKLDTTEFSAWMVALKTATDPATSAESAETKSWVGAAFVQADKDKSSAVTQAELTGFLSQGAS